MSDSSSAGRSERNQRTHAAQQQQRPASAAWDWVSEAKGHAKAARYGTLARKLPSMFQVSGLGQTFAFLFSKGYVNGEPKSDKAEALLFQHLGGYLIEVTKRSQLPDQAMEALLSLQAAEYRAATRKLAEISEWLKRFAEGNLPREKGE